MVLPRSFSARVSARPVTFCFEISKMPRGAAWISPPVGFDHFPFAQRRTGRHFNLAANHALACVIVSSEKNIFYGDALTFHNLIDLLYGLRAFDCILASFAR